VHLPVSLKAGERELPVKKEDLLPFDDEGVWKAMEECQKLGLAKSIGVSNFSCKKLEKLLSIAEIPPAVNQVSLSLVHSNSCFPKIDPEKKNVSHNKEKLPKTYFPKKKCLFQV